MKWEALKGRDRSRRWQISPLQGFGLIATRFPRALPWAIVFRPFGAKVPDTFRGWR